MSKFLYVHVYRKRLTFALALTLLGSALYVFYQVLAFAQIREAEADQGDGEHPAVAGIDPRQRHLYAPRTDGTFRCTTSGERIAYGRVNDDYCDCADGSDEPGTDACPGGMFHCARPSAGYPRAVPSGRVNDMVCDCCDGSDEWKRRGAVGPMDGRRMPSGRVRPGPCPVLCGNRDDRRDR